MKKEVYEKLFENLASMTPEEKEKEWEAFKKLYNETFNKPICEYEIICSEGVTRL